MGVAEPLFDDLMSRVFPPVDRSSKAVSFVDEIMSRISIEKSWKIPEIKPSGQEIPAYDAFVKSMVKRLDRLPIRVKRVLIKKRYGLHKALKSKSEEETNRPKWISLKKTGSNIASRWSLSTSPRPPMSLVSLLWS